MFSIFRKLNPSLSDLSERDKMELFSLAEKTLIARMPDVKERTFIEQRLGVPINRLSDFQSYIDVGSKKVWASFRACHLVGSVLVSADTTAYRVSKSGEEEPLDSNDPALMLIKNPNPFDSWEELVYMWTFHMKLCGTAYLLKDANNGKGQPLGLYPLLPQYISAIPDPKIKVGGWEYKVNGTIIKLKPEEIIQFRRPHPNNLMMGLGDVEASQDTFSSFIARGVLEERFLENGAQPSGILIKKEAVEDDKQWEAFKFKFNSQYAGKSNAGKTAFINGEWDYKKLGLTMQEMQQIEREKWTIEQIFLIHGVPLSVAGLREAANYATARQDAIAFRKNECVPLLDLLVGRLNMTGGLAYSYGEDIRYGYNITGLIDVEQAAKDYGPLVERGAMTPNEFRTHCGLAKSEDPYLDQFFINRNLIPIVMAGVTNGSSSADPIQTEPNE